MENVVGVENAIVPQLGRRSDCGGNDNNNHPPPPPLPLQKCPRCDSFNTKFCYYNNYSLAQPRHYCKSCRRYWTHGGTLRNVPIGGGSRKSKRATLLRIPPFTLSNGRAQGSFPAPVTRLSNPTAVIPPPPRMGNSFFSGGSFLTSLGSMPPPGQGNAGTLNFASGGGSSGGQFGGHMGLLHGVSRPLRSPAAARQFQQPPATHYFPPPPPPGVMSSEFFPWSQGFVNTGGSTSPSGGWNCNTGGAGNNQAGNSFGNNNQAGNSFGNNNQAGNSFGNNNQAGNPFVPNWSDLHKEFNHSQ